MTLRPILLSLAVVLAIPGAGLAQDTPTWRWAWDGNIFFGLNRQDRRFVDVTAWESQNWGMLAVDRPVRSTDRFTVMGMLSVEAFTIDPQGSPQLFQTGESYQQVPLVNYQHPHDLLMNLGATYRLVRPGASFVFGADLVGTPTLGPTPFMHRASARDNPQVPLTHHYFDSTHSTPGVIRGGVELGTFALEASVFRGEGPDEDRLNLEQPRLNSWAVRGRWKSGPWSAQVSGGDVKQPEWFEPFDATRLTASLSYEGSIGTRPLAAMLAFGENRQFNGFNGNTNAYLAEAVSGITTRSTLYGRAEVAGKEIFGVGPHEKQYAHRHWISTVGAFTVGYSHLLPRLPVAIGADLTLYHIPTDLQTYYEPSRSFHVFVHWRPRTGQPATHVH
jgi:hypothetical protein